MYHHIQQDVEHIPCETVLITSKDKVWMTPLVKSIISKRWYAWRTGDTTRYRHYREKAKAEIIKAKNRWAMKARKGAKGAWKIVNEIRGKKKLDFVSEIVNSNPQTNNNDWLHEITANLQRNFNWHPKQP